MLGKQRKHYNKHNNELQITNRMLDGLNLILIGYQQPFITMRVKQRVTLKPYTVHALDEC